MHAPKLTTEDVNLIARALDTLAEQSTALKNGIVAQIRAAQIEAQKKAAEAAKPAKKK